MQRLGTKSSRLRVPISQRVVQLRWLACKDSGHQDLLLSDNSTVKGASSGAAWGRTRPRRTPLLSTHATVPAAGGDLHGICLARHPQVLCAATQVGQRGQVGRHPPARRTAVHRSAIITYSCWLIPLSKRWKAVDTVRQLATAAIRLFRTPACKIYNINFVTRAADYVGAFGAMQ